MNRLYVNTIIMNGTDCTSQNDFMKELAKLQLPIEGIEVRREYFSSDKKEREQQFLDILETGKLNNWKLRYSVPEPLFTKNGINNQFSEWLAEGKAMEVESIKLNIGNLSGITQIKNSEFKQFLADESFKITIENDQTYDNGSLNNVLKSLSLIEKQNLQIGYTFDLGNWMVIEENPQKSFIETKKYISIFHLKNMNTQNQSVLLDKGQLSWRDYLIEDWPIVLEYPMDFNELKSEIKKVKEVD